MERFHGTAVSGGIGIGRVIILEDDKPHFPDARVTDTAAEKKRLRDAIEVFSNRTKSMAERVRLNVGNKEAAILEAQIMMVHDSSMSREMEKIIDLGYSAEHAVSDVCETFYKMFENIDDKVIKGRASDISDVRARLLRVLLGRKEVDYAEISKDSILVTNDLTPSMASQIVKGTIAGIVTELGSKTSHSAILARALGIPAVFSIKNFGEQVQDGDLLIVDGSSGDVVAKPDEQTLSEFEERRACVSVGMGDLEAFRGQPTRTKDGKRLEVYCNVGLAADADAAVASDCEGVGLFRTELLFMEKSKMPTEDEQFAYYKEILQKMQNREVVIRTLDVGGEKHISYLHMEQEDNPFLGYRGIRYSLGHLKEYRTQLRALLRASVYGRMSILIPMITCVDELRTVRGEIAQVKKELRAKGIAYSEDVKIGVMIETAAAAMIADILAKECDFFSIGTNDLIQYTMSVDRGNPGVEYLFSVYQPSVLRMIRGIIRAANDAGIAVSMCGEAAADEMMIPLLLAFGLDRFSVSPRNVLPVRSLISGWSAEEAEKTADAVMGMSTQGEIIEYLKKTV